MEYFSNPIIASMTQEEFADWRRKENAHIIFHRGHCWEEIYPGFYRPIHMLARLKSEEASRPTPFSWGFGTSLCKDDAALANGFIPVHLLSDVEDYDLHSLKKNCRRQILKNKSVFKIMELIDSEILQQQGYEVYLSTVSRTNAKPVISKKKYIEGLKDFVAPKRRLILAGFMGENLCGYITGYSVDSTAYGEFVYIATEALKNHLNKILVFEFAQACRHSRKIKEIFIGQHWKENPGVTQFKEEMGFPIKHIPAKVQINPILEKVIRWRSPDKYYRLTGR